MTSDTTLTTLTTETQNLRCHLSTGIFYIQFFSCYLRMTILTTPNLRCHLSMKLIFPMSFKKSIIVSVFMYVWILRNNYLVGSLMLAGPSPPKWAKPISSKGLFYIIVHEIGFTFRLLTMNVGIFRLLKYRTSAIITWASILFSTLKNHFHLVKFGYYSRFSFYLRSGTNCRITVCKYQPS